MLLGKRVVETSRDIAVYFEEYVGLFLYVTVITISWLAVIGLVMYLVCFTNSRLRLKPKFSIGPDYISFVFTKVWGILNSTKGNIPCTMEKSEKIFLFWSEDTRKLENSIIITIHYNLTKLFGNYWAQLYLYCAGWPKLTFRIRYSRNYNIIGKTFIRDKFNDLGNNLCSSTKYAIFRHLAKTIITYNFIKI